MKITKEKVREINNKHMFETDKWFRMNGGISSTLIDYKNDIAHIEIKNTESRFKSDINLTVKIRDSWKRTFDSSLKEIKGFVFYLYKTNKSTGFMVVPKTVKTQKSIKELTDKMNVVEELILVGIFSGVMN